MHVNDQSSSSCLNVQKVVKCNKNIAKCIYEFTCALQYTFVMMLLCVDLQMLWHSAMHITMKGVITFGSMMCHALERNLCFSNVLIADLVFITAGTVRMLVSGVKVMNGVSS